VVGPVKTRSLTPVPRRVKRTYLIQPIKKTRVAEEIADRIRVLILDGTLPPGQPLPGERLLAARFGVSRGSIRDAFRLLETIGLLETRHGQGTFPRELDVNRLVAPLASILTYQHDLRDELLDVRLMFEPAVARAAAARVTDDDLADLQRILDTQRRKLKAGGSTIIDGTLNSIPNSTFQVELFSNTLCDPSGYGEGQTYLGSTWVRTDGSCNANFEVTFPVNVAPGSFITATATDVAGNTSEFSACRPLGTGEAFFSITPCRVADTRNLNGPYGGPALPAGADRSFVIAGQCGIPTDARAVAFNFAVTQPTASGDLQVFPAGTPVPTPATVYYSAQQTRAKNAILGLGLAGDIGAHVDQPAGTVHLVIDVTGYFR